MWLFGSIRTREINDEMIAVEFHQFTEQIGSDVKASATGFVCCRGHHDHSNGQCAVTRQDEVLTQKLVVLRLGRIS